jgi:hypothetical protein
MTIGPNEEEIVIEVDQIVHNLLLGVSSGQFIAGLNPIRAQIGLGFLENFLPGLLLLRHIKNGQRKA